MTKRLLDISASAPGLLILASVLVTIALLVRIKHGAPILFRRQRPGKDGKPFNMLKFRTTCPCFITTLFQICPCFMRKPLYKYPCYVFTGENLCLND